MSNQLHDDIKENKNHKSEETNFKNIVNYVIEVTNEETRRNVIFLMGRKNNYEGLCLHLAIILMLLIGLLGATFYYFYEEYPLFYGQLFFVVIGAFFFAGMGLVYVILDLLLDIVNFNQLIKSENYIDGATSTRNAISNKTVEVDYLAKLKKTNNRWLNDKVDRVLKIKKRITYRDLYIICEIASKKDMYF